MQKIKPFYINESSILINLSQNKCYTYEDLLKSDGFKQILSKFILSINENSRRDVQSIIKNAENIDEIIDLFKILLKLSFEEAVLCEERFIKFEPLRNQLIVFVESLFDFWRGFERYGIIQRQYIDINADNSILIEMTAEFSKIVLSFYRKLLSRLLSSPIRVYRQTPAGFNAGFIVSPSSISLPNEYDILKGIDVINCVMIRTPFIGHSKSNTRSGLFNEINDNPVKDLKLTKRHWLCYPIKVGELIAYVYFHRTFLHHGISLSNLFEPAIKDYFEGKKPDIVFVYGSHEQQFDKSFYVDQKNNIYVGYVSRFDKNDYFGYMKKMLLTLHNVSIIKNGKLPIHGAMVNIVLNNDNEKNLVIIGDSGAGKSETLEALRYISDTKVKEINVIFDDMGYFYMKNNQIFAKGTEIGAFVRLDDLDVGYAYKELDRGIFLNPERINARVIIPNSTYSFITKEHKIDYIFYANNYEDKECPIRYFDNVSEALEVFMLGKRKAKGTTSESGIVTSFFANPFGPVQLMKETNRLIERIFITIFNCDIKVGELYTKLSVPGKETEGIYTAAKAIFKIL